MNDLVKDLLKQSTYEILGVPQVDQKKFAELIVRECSQFVEDKFDFCGDELIIAEQILKHFGVE